MLDYNASDFMSLFWSQISKIIIVVCLIFAIYVIFCSKQVTDQHIL